jgi:hypothetical protein
MNPDEVSQAIALARSDAWIPLATLVISVLVRLSKTDAAVEWFPINVQPRMRAVYALILGAASGIVAGLAGGGHWPSALAGGVVAGALAITTHEVVVEGFRNGRDIGTPKAPMFPPGDGAP